MRLFTLPHLYPLPPDEAQENAHARNLRQLSGLSFYVNLVPIVVMMTTVAAFVPTIAGVLLAAVVPIAGVSLAAVVPIAGVSLAAVVPIAGVSLAVVPRAAVAASVGAATADNSHRHP